MLNYQNISDEKELQLLECCRDNGGNDTPPSDCCYDSWKTALIPISAQLAKANALVIYKQNEYDLAWEWKEKLGVWCKDWELTDEKADALCRQLSRFIIHLENVCCITEKTNDAIKILFCMIEDLYKRVDKLKISYDELMQCINCLKRPELAPGVGIMKTIEDYGKKLDIVIAMREVLITKTITVIELAYGLRSNICSHYGLKGILEYWKEKLNCCEENKEKSERPCHDSTIEICHLEPHISFPIDKDGYYLHLEKAFDDAKKRVEKLKNELDNEKNKRDKLQAGQTGLEKAIKEMDATNICKP